MACCKGGSRTAPTRRVVGLLAFASAVLPPVASAARTFALGPVGAIRAAGGGAVLCVLERRAASISQGDVGTLCYAGHAPANGEWLHHG